MKCGIALAWLAFASLTASANETRIEPVPENDPKWFVANLGGNATLVVANEAAYASPLPTLPAEDLRTFAFGNRLFNTHWVASPASVDAFDGLGPLFNRVSCSSCHTRDGRGQPPATGQPLESMLIRLSVPGTDTRKGVRPVPRYGDQLNEKAIQGVRAEGQTRVTYSERSGQYPDGSSYTLAVPHYEFTLLAYGPLPQEVRISPRVAPPVFGLGLLEAVPASLILAHADAEDLDADGISGRPNLVWDQVTNQQTLGRFGWKAAQPTLFQQNASAASSDIGLTTQLFPQQALPGKRSSGNSAPRSAQPEMSNEFLGTLTAYLRSLAVPAARNVSDAGTRRGAQLFVQIGCEGCHLATLRTAAQPDLPASIEQDIHPFTDLLLHDMGEELADQRSEFAASGTEWRTPPLWGIGLTAVVNRHTRFLHDGRARSLEEAILWHGGEASAARQRFMQLAKPQRETVLGFLHSL